MTKESDQKFLVAMLKKGGSNTLIEETKNVTAEINGESEGNETPETEGREKSAEVSISTQVSTSKPISTHTSTQIPTQITLSGAETPIVPIARAIPTPPKNHNSKNPNETRSKRTSFLVRPSVFEKIREVVIKKRISLNDAVEEALLDYYEKHKN